VLVILVGPAVRLSEFVSASDKRYQAIIRLGSTTDTFDADGKITPSDEPVNVTEEQFEAVLKTFIGEIEQTPPPYSASKCRDAKPMRWRVKARKWNWRRARSRFIISRSLNGAA